MPPPWKALAAGGVILGGICALVLASRRSGPTPPSRVALIGDSYAVGLGPELQKLLPDFESAGVESTNTSQWARHAAKCDTCGDWLAAFKPDLVLVSLGVNDGSTPDPANYQTIVRRLHGLGARVLWIEPPAAVKTPAVRAVIASLGVSTVPAPMLPMANSLHPTVLGYRQWAGDVVQAVNAKA